MATYTKRLSSTSIMEQPDNHSLIVATPATFAATDTGSTTTIVSTSLGSYTDSNDDMVGKIVECLFATNTQNEGKRVRILATDDGASTFTTDAFPAATASGDTFALYTPPHAFFVEETGTHSNTDIVDSNNRDEADDYYIGTATEGGPRIEVVRSDSISTSDHPLVDDWVSSGGTLTVGTAFDANVTQGDLFEAWRHPEFFSLAVDHQMEDVPRDVMTGDLFSEGPIKGLRASSVTGELAFRGPGGGTYSELYPFLRCLYTVDGGDDLTADSGGSVSSVAYDSGTAEAGSLYLTASGDVFSNLADVATPIVPYPSLRVAPEEDSTIARMITFRPSSSVNLSLAMKSYIGDGVMYYDWGYLPMLSFEGAKGLPMKITLSGDALDHLVVGSSAAHTRPWSPVRSTVAPRALGVSRVVVGSSSYKCRRFKFDPGPVVTKQIDLSSPNHVAGWYLTGWEASGEVEVYLDSTDRTAIDDFVAGKEQQILMQTGVQGSDPGVFAVYCASCQFTGVSVADDTGGVTLTLPFKVNRPTATTYSPFVLGIV